MPARLIELEKVLVQGKSWVLLVANSATEEANRKFVPGICCHPNSVQQNNLK